MNRLARWSLIPLTALLLAGCGATEQSTEAAFDRINQGLQDSATPTPDATKQTEDAYRLSIGSELRTMSEALANVATTASKTIRPDDLTVFRSAAQTMRESTLRISKMTPPPSFASFHEQVLDAARVCRDGTAPMALWDTLPRQSDLLLAASGMEKCQAAFEPITLP